MVDRDKKGPEMKRYLPLVVGTALAGLTVGCNATSLGYWDLHESVNLSAVVAQVQITASDPIKFDGSNSEVCGYRMHAHIVESYKGQKSGDFIFFSGSDEDILADHPNYFVIVNPRASTTEETILDGKKCDSRGIPYAVDSNFQTVFPIQMDPSTGKPEFLLISRHSPITNGNFVSSKSSYIELFAVFDHRIYALASWVKVYPDITNWIEHPE